jgi:hypothetical protein
MEHDNDDANSDSESACSLGLQTVRELQQEVTTLVLDDGTVQKVSSEMREKCGDGQTETAAPPVHEGHDSGIQASSKSNGSPEETGGAAKPSVLVKKDEIEIHLKLNKTSITELQIATFFDVPREKVKVVYAQKKMRGNVPVMSHKPSFAFVGVSREKLFAAAPHAEEVVRTWQGDPGRSPNTFDVVIDEESDPVPARFSIQGASFQLQNAL